VLQNTPLTLASPARNSTSNFVYYFYVHVSVDYVACKWRCAPFVRFILNKETENEENFTQK